MLREEAKARVAYAVWRDAGAGTWRPDPEDILRVDQKGWMCYVRVRIGNRLGCWPIPKWTLYRLMAEARHDRRTN